MRLEAGTAHVACTQDWSKSWLETAGLNTVRPEFVDDGEGNIKSFSILQTAPENHPTLRYHKFDVRAVQAV